MQTESITVNIVHPTNGKCLTAEVARTMTVGEILNELIATEFILFDSSYEMACGGRILRSTDTLNDAGILNEQKLMLVPLTEAG